MAKFQVLFGKIEFGPFKFQIRNFRGVGHGTGYTDAELRLHRCSWRWRRTAPATPRVAAPVKLLVAYGRDYVAGKLPFRFLLTLLAPERSEQSSRAAARRAGHLPPPRRRSSRPKPPKH